MPSYRLLKSRVLRERPEFVFLPLIVLLFGVNLAPFGFGPGYGSKFVAYLGDPNQGGIFPITWAVSWGTFALALVAAHRWTTIRTVRSMMIAISLPFGATGVFEIVYQLVGAWVQPVGFHMSMFSWVSIVLWAAVGATSVAQWRISWEFGLVLGLFLGGFALWGVEGYSQITWGSALAEPWAYGFNISLKVGAFALFLLPMLRGWKADADRTGPTVADPAPRAEPLMGTGTTRP